MVEFTQHFVGELSLSTVVNLTPHEVTVYAADGKKVMWKFPSVGALRLKSEGPQTVVGHVRNAEADVPIMRGQTFVGLDEKQSGYAHYAADSRGRFIVSLATAQWLAENGAARGLLGERVILCPATSPSQGVRDEGGQILGCKSLEVYVP